MRSKRMRYILLLTAVVLIVGQQAGVVFGRTQSVTFPPRPGERDFVLDLGDLLTYKHQEEIVQICDTLLTDKAIPIIVVTIESMSEYGADGWSIGRYARNLFDEWGIGWDELQGQQSGKIYSWNYGILLLVSTGDRKARIELGADWGHEKDDACQRIMNDFIVAKFKQRDFSGGILLGVKALEAMAREKQLPMIPRPWWHYALVVGFIVLMIGTAHSLYKSGASGWAWVFWGAVFALLGWLLISFLTSSRRGGGSAGFSGGSFGGGFSGGGGATGSW